MPAGPSGASLAIVRWQSTLLLAAVPVLLYGRTVAFDFVHADDLDLIAGNQSFLQDLSRLPEAFTRSYFETEQDAGTLETYYRPMAIVSFMLDAQSAGANPAIYHLTNVVLHAVTVVLLGYLLIALGASERTALVVAALFAVHPLNTQAVAWIAGRNELLLGLFILVAFLSYVEYARTSRPAWLALHGAATTLALFSKETAAIVPFGIGLHALLFRTITTRAAIGVATSELIAVMVWWFMRSQALAGSSAVNATFSDALGQSWQILTYVGKLLAPVRLNVMPGPDIVTIGLGGGALLALGVGLAVARSLSVRHLAFALGWVLLFISPSVLVPALPAYEHRMYVPLMGAAIGLTGVLAPTTRAVRVGVVVALLFAAQAFLQSAVFRNAMTYWQNGTASARYAPIAHVNLGQLREQAGDSVGAQQHYRRALSLDPDTPKARNNLGVVLMQLGQTADAVALFREEVRRFPQNADAWFNLGLWAEMQGDAAEARRHYERALTENPAYRPAAEKLGRRTP